jgi:diketogulonate reductase-like aldo/keto reductase
MTAWHSNREELFITSKVFNNHHQPERTIKAIHNTLKNLQIAYLVRLLA